MFVLLCGVWVVSIQPDAKGLDIEAWSESDELDDVEETSVLEDASQGVNEAPNARDGAREDGARDHVGAVLMERETMSESNIHDVARSSRSNDSSFDRTRSGRLQILLSPERAFRYPSPLSPPTRSLTHHRRRTTLDIGSHASSSRAGYSTQLSPPLLPLNSLGSGFQIGLSPVSPGFSIVPRERGSRRSGLGLADVVGEATLSQEERQRRRTVSEGDMRRRALALAQRRDEDRLDERGNGDDGSGAGGEEHVVTRPGKGKGREDKRRWNWLRRVIRG